MDNIKLTAKFELPGAAMYTEADCALDGDKYKFHAMLLSHEEGKGKNRKTVTDKITFLTRKCKPAMQVVNISQEAYNEWLHIAPIDARNMGEYSLIKTLKDWKKLSNDEKIKAHLEAMAMNLGGKYVTHFIYPD